ncbi:MAG: HNH endonuclease [Bacteroidales bacterium]|nr:HNH endonuclease [Bacteroidales bacterium]
MPRRKFSASMRLFVAQRAEFLCEYCHTPEDFSPDSFDIEHIISLLKGGTSDDDNLALACGGCNGAKYIHTSWPDPVTGATSPLFNPRADKWDSHFAWSEDFAFLVGLTPTGRATIERLRMNRPGLVNLRKALLSYDAHPKI